MSNSFRPCSIKVILNIDGLILEHIEYNWRNAYERATIVIHTNQTHLMRAGNWCVYFLIQSKLNDANTNGIADADTSGE
jgi:hypothetical protein